MTGMRLQRTILMWRWRQAEKHSSPAGITGSIWARRMRLTFKLTRLGIPRRVAWWLVKRIPDLFVPKYRIE